MMPGIIISLIFSEQGKLVFCATPLQNEFASAVETINNPANVFGIQITAAKFPKVREELLVRPLTDRPPPAVRSCGD